MTDSVFHSGYVAVIGRPNVGKSTLINALLGQKVAAVSSRPQTTRRRQLGILTLPDAQVIFVDTPGLHVPYHKLGEFMNAEAEDALQDADLVAWMVDLNEPPTEEDRLIAARLGKLRRRPPVLLVLNKADLVPDEQLPARQAAFQALYPAAQPLLLSALGGEGRALFLESVLARLPEGPLFYDEEQVTDLYEREIAADLIRQSAMTHLHDEVPHALGVRIDEYSERSEEMDYIAATLLVEREAHKGIVIGKNGEMIKRIGSTARGLIEEMTGRKSFLELRVKVSENWRDDASVLRLLGYTRRRE